MGIERVELVEVSFNDEFSFLSNTEREVLMVLLGKIKKENTKAYDADKNVFISNIMVDYMFSSSSHELKFTIEHIVNVLSSEQFRGDMEVLKVALESIMRGVSEVNKNA